MQHLPIKHGLARRIRGAVFLFLSIIVLRATAFSGNAQWSSKPTSNDWNTAENWVPNIVPSGLNDIAAFDASAVSDVSISANILLNSIVYNSAAKSYGIIVQEGFTLYIDGTGVLNNSGATQNFISQSNGNGEFGTILFTNSATAGSNTVFTTYGGVVSGMGGPAGIEFFDTATAGNGSFINNGSSRQAVEGGETAFHGTSTAGNATFTNNSANISTSNAGSGLVIFLDHSTASHATFTNNAATLIAARGGLTDFSHNSSAGDATFINNGASASGMGSGATVFGNQSSAGQGTFTNNGGVTRFENDATAAASTLIANAGANGVPGGEIVFDEGSFGGTARIEVFGNGDLDISTHNAAGVTIGSLEGSGNVFLGPNNLTVGSNNRTVDFTGVIQEGSGNLPGGTLTKIGTGTLALEGANTFPGMTTVNAGVLNVDGSLAGPVTVNGGLLVGRGTVGAVTINDRLSPGEDEGILNVHGNLTMMPGSTYVAVLFGRTAGIEYNQANVSGKVTLTQSTLAIDLEYFPRIGDKYIIIKNDGSDPIKGKFQGLGEGAKFTHDGLRFKISYKGNGGNDVVITRIR